MGAQLASAHSALNMKLQFSLLQPLLPLSLKPRQRLIPTTTVLATVLATATVATVLATDASTTARGRLRLRLPPRLRLILTFCMVDWGLTATVLATATVFTEATTTARGRLRLPPRLRLTPTFWMVDTMDWDTEDTDTVSTTATTTARGRLRLLLRLRLTPTFCMVDMVLDMVILATATVLATGDTTGDKLPTPLQDLNHRRKTLTLFV